MGCAGPLTHHGPISLRGRPAEVPARLSGSLFPEQSPALEGWGAVGSGCQWGPS